MSREAFLAERKQGVGGSDCAALFNVGYGCRRRLWYDKSNIDPDFLRETTLAMELGNVLEPFFVKQFSGTTGRKVEANTVLYHSRDEPLIIAHIDAIQYGPEKGVVEVKSQGRGAFWATKKNGLPEDYVLQLQHCMIASGCNWGSFVIGSRDSGEMLYWDVNADRDIQASIIAEVPVFWSQVQSGIAPEALEPEDKRCQSCEYRVTCHGASLAVGNVDVDFVRDDSLFPLATEYDQRRALLKEAKDLLEDTRSELICKLGNRSAVLAGKAKVKHVKIPKKEYVVKAHEEVRLTVTI